MSLFGQHLTPFPQLVVDVDLNRTDIRAGAAKC